MSLEIVYKKVVRILLSATKGKEKSGTELNRVGLGWHWNRWWLGYGLANGAETAVMTPVAAGIGLQRQNNKAPDAATGQLSGIQGSKWLISHLIFTQCNINILTVQYTLYVLRPSLFVRLVHSTTVTKR